MSMPRVAVITGGSRGIGRGIVEELAALGMAVGVNYRGRADAAEEACAAARERGAPRAVALQADVSDPEQGRGLVDAALAAFGRIDVWVNNAGIAPERRADLLELEPESWDRVLGTNLRGPFFLTQAVAHAMIQMQAAGVLSAPQIHFITSISSVAASVNRGEYCVSKAGLSMVARLFAARLASEGIAVHEIQPGLIRTDMTAAVAETYDRRIEAGLVPMGRWGTPADVGRAVAALAAGGLAYSTGTVLEVDGGLMLPRF